MAVLEKLTSAELYRLTNLDSVYLAETSTSLISSGSEYEYEYENLDYTIGNKIEQSTEDI
ncbi:hypothetical protein N7528_000327 [Penicillium herquei]|nr:hypothetical protein N7528_000327 [Penicillium herquei]